MREVLKRSVGVQLGVAGVLGSLVGEAGGGAIGAALVTSLKRAAGSRAANAIETIKRHYEQHNELPKAKDFGVGEFASNFVLVGSSTGIGAYVQVAFEGDPPGPDAKSIKHPGSKGLDLRGKGETYGSLPEWKQSHLSFETVRFLDVSPYCERGSGIAVVTKQELSLVPYYDHNPGKAFLTYIAYACIHGRCVTAEDLGISSSKDRRRWLKWRFDRSSFRPEAEEWIKKRIETHPEEFEELQEQEED